MVDECCQRRGMRVYAMAFPFVRKIEAVSIGSRCRVVSIFELPALLFCEERSCVFTNKRINREFNIRDHPFPFVWDLFETKRREQSGVGVG
jgi:hypothetical protein